MAASEENRAWNACAIVKGVRYVYYKSYLKTIRVKMEVQKRNW